MKKLVFAGLLAGSFMFGGICASAIDVYVDNQKLELSNAPIIENDRTLIPMRSVFEALGANVQWVDSEKTAVAYKGLDVLQLTIDSNTMLVNGGATSLDAPARLIDEKTYVPLRAVSENLNYEVEWDGKTRSIYINTPLCETDVKNMTLTDTVSDGDVKKIVSICLTYPQIDNAKAEEFNLYYAGKTKDLLESIKTAYNQHIAEFGTEVFEKDGKIVPVFIYGGYEKVYDKNGLLSFVEQIYASQGTDTTINALYTYNYDLNNGKKLEKSDILNVIDSELAQLDMYSFYIYDDVLYLCLDSDHTKYYEAGYSPSVALPYDGEWTDYFKIDLTDGKTRDFGDPLPLFDDEGNGNGSENILPPSDSVEYNSSEALKRQLGFKMAELADSTPYKDVKYYIVQDNIGKIVYTDFNEESVTLLKAEGDVSLINADPKSAVKEGVIGNSYTYFYENKDGVFCEFSIETDDAIYSYVIAASSKNLKALENMAKDIIKREEKNK